MAFPTTAVLDDFNRANAGPPPSASWTATGVDSATPTLAVDTNLCISTGGANDGGVWGTSVGPDSEIYVTASAWPNGAVMHLYLRCADTGTAGLDGYRCTLTRVDANPGFRVQMFRMDNNVATALGSTVNDTGGTFSAGNMFGFEALGSDLTIYINRGSWVSAKAENDPTYSVAGMIAMKLVNISLFVDDFGGGTIVESAPTLMLVMGMLGTGRV